MIVHTSPTALPAFLTVQFSSSSVEEMVVTVKEVGWAGAGEGEGERGRGRKGMAEGSKRRRE